MPESRNKVTVSPAPRQAEGGWTLDAVLADGKGTTIKQFRTQAEASEWLGSAAHLRWLRDSRASPHARTAVAAFNYLRAPPRVLAWVAAAAKWLAPLKEQWSAGKLIISASWRRAVRGRPLTAIAVLLTAILIIAALGRTDQPAQSRSLAASQTDAVPHRDRSHSIEGLDTADAIALLIGRLSSSDAEAEDRSSRSVTSDDLQGNVPATPPRQAVRTPARLAIEGVWVPEPASCSARNVLPAVISARGARAGETSCVFTSQKQTERDWRMLASCSSPSENWTTSVRLTVIGDRLTWTSKRGIQTYTRCRSDV